MISFISLTKRLCFPMLADSLGFLCINLEIGKFFFSLSSYLCRRQFCIKRKMRTHLFISCHEKTCLVAYKIKYVVYLCFKGKNVLYLERTLNNTHL